MGNNNNTTGANGGATGNSNNSAATNAAAASFARLVSKLDYLSAEDLRKVRQAYRFADESHLGQLRSSGEPYITHPIAVAAQCAEWKLDAQALMAALLHDALEDCGVTKMELIERFGSPVAELVDGLTKLDKLHFNTREENQAESFRKMLLAMARDTRVILIKLADRSHNMRTLSDMPRSKWGRIASETLDIYAPIAHRLGLNQTYRELQDLSFRHLLPWRYAILSKAVTKERSKRRDVVQKVQRDVEAAFAKAGIAIRMAGREKSLYSIYRKMDDKHLSFAQITDIFGFRVIVPTLFDCYTALGVLHQMYKPLPGKFKDHIAIPKFNGYQSLHTTLIGPANVTVEFQTRTEEMHAVAETGVAAHWLYKSDSGHAPADGSLGSKWLQSLVNIQDETHDATEFWDHVKLDLFPEDVYVFTPKGQILSMPRGATIIDFAYAIHSSVGDHTVSAKVNNNPMPLQTEIRNGDVVEIETQTDATPNPAWLNFVRTGRARSRIRHHLKTLAHTEAADLGLRLLAQAIRAEGIEHLPDNTGTGATVWDKLLRFTGSKTQHDLLTDLGLGKRVANIVGKRLALLLADCGQKPDALLLTRERFAAQDPSVQTSLTIDGSENASVQFAKCCRPIPDDAIVGYLGRGEGLVIHQPSCAVAKKLLNKDSERFIKVVWADDLVRTFETTIVVTAKNKKGVLAKVAGALSAAEADIVHIDMGHSTHQQQDVEMHFLVAVRDVTHLDAALRSLHRTASVMAAKRR